MNLSRVINACPFGKGLIWQRGATRVHIDQSGVDPTGSLSSHCWLFPMIWMPASEREKEPHALLPIYSTHTRPIHEFAAALSLTSGSMPCNLLAALKTHLNERRVNLPNNAPPPSDF